ncbi:MAG: GNAT family N-acetyltransferase [bacterium]
MIRELIRNDMKRALVFLDRDHIHNLFLVDNIRRLGADPRVQFFGYFDGRGEIEGISMFYLANLSLYATSVEAVKSFVDLACKKGAKVLVGRRESVDAFLRFCNPHNILSERMEVFCELNRENFRDIGVMPTRRATPQDLKDLVKHYLRSSANRNPRILREELAERIKSYDVFIGLRGRSIVSSAYTIAESPLAAYIGGVFTLPEYRGNGYGASCVGRLCSEILRRGKRPALFYYEDNLPAAKLYRKLGFVETARWKIVTLRSIWG